MKPTLPPVKSGAPKKLPTPYKLAGVATPHRGSTKPHIRMRKLKSVAASAFPQAQAAFPTDGGADPATPDDASAGPAMGAAPGTMGT